MDVGLVFEQHSTLSQLACDALVGVEHLLSGPGGDLVREAAGVVDRTHDRDVGRFADRHVVLTEARRHVHGSGAVLGRDECGGENPERVLCLLEERKQRSVAASCQLLAPDGSDALGR